MKPLNHSDMLSLKNSYRVQFQKREPILVAGSSFVEVLSRLEKDNSLSPVEGDEIVSITLVSFPIFV